MIKSIIETELFKMSNVIRYSGSKVLSKENLAEHSYYVSIIADMIAEHIENTEKIKIDRYKVLKFALYHDVEEIFTGDIITPVKYKSKTLNKELEKIGKIMLNEGLENDFKEFEYIKNNIINYFEDYEEHKYDKIENQIVKFSDQLEAFIYSATEIKLGNKYFEQIIDTIYHGIKDKWKDNKYLGKFIEELENYYFYKILTNK